MNISISDTLSNPISNPISNWDDEYANGAHIPGAEELPALWTAAASAWRQELLRSNRCQLDIAYGSQERQRYDIFQPAVAAPNAPSNAPSNAARGTLVFVHGGYWKATDKSFWSHLAAGPVARGWQVVMPSYTLCPDNTIAGITAEVANCIAHCSEGNNLPLRLAGHSAGGHLVSRMACQHSPLHVSVQSRIESIVSISGVHDLRPLLQTSMNDILQLNERMAIDESPVMQRPAAGTRLCCYVGADERPEFVRQNSLLANVWRGLGAATLAIEEPGKHHFSVIDGLTDSGSALTSLLTGDVA